MQLIIVGLTALLAGFIQTVTGFGGGIINMLVLPYIVSLATASGINGCITLFLNISLVVYFWKHINFKKILWPAVIAMELSTLAINLVTVLPVDTLKLVFSIFIVILAIYFNFFNKVEINDTPFTMIICSAISGLGNGLFGIAGPPMVLYYLSACKKKEEYLGTIQLFFLIIGFYASIVRLLSGIITADLLPSIISGIIMVLVGKKLGTLVVDKLSVDKMKKYIYIFLGIVGVIQLIQCF